MIKKLNFCYVLILAISLMSCASKKDILYLQDIENYDTRNDSTFNDLRIQRNDLLSIIVSSTDQKSSIPFNLPVVASSSGSTSTVNTKQEIQTYLVDEVGNIDFPVLGKLKVLNKTKLEVIAELKQDLVKYIKEPIIALRITNFRISVLGEVNNPGLYEITNERVTIFQAMSLAGDLTIYGKRDDVLVIRENKNGKKIYNKLDFTSKDILLSPYYYLKQNDVVIVSPNKAQIQSSAFNRNTAIWVSIAGVIISVISVFTN